MKLQILAAFAALAAVSATPAFADDAITAKLAQPVPAPVKFIAGGAMFKCEADACVALAPTSATFAAATCKVVADKVGPVTAFTQMRALADDKLADCNAKAVAKLDGAKLAKQ